MQKTAKTIVGVGLALASFGGVLFSQQTQAVTANSLRLDLRPLGHPPLDVIPPGESAVTALAIGADGCLYGGTTGERAHLFVLDPKAGRVFPLGHLPGEKSIYHSLAAGPDGLLYLGTSLAREGRIAERGKDVLASYAAYKGGHIYRFDPKKERDSRVRMQTADPGRPLPFADDLGVPVPGEGIVSLVMGEGRLFGMTFPNGHFFSLDLESGKAEDLGPICAGPLFEEPFKSVPRALVKDARGRIWGAGDFGALFHYDPASGKVVSLPEVRLPAELGREFKTVLDAAIPGPDGWLYGGTSDGFLFRFDPEKPAVVNLGKPQWQYRIRGLAFSQSGDLYGIGGERGGAARMFVLRKNGGGYEDLGILDVNRSPYYAWLAYEAESMIAGPDGTIFIGESDRISHLYLLFPWER
jgi:hypothetical protein